MKPKSMRPIKELLADWNNPQSSLTDDEERLLDRHMFAKTGQHIGKFKKKIVKPKSSVPTVGKSTIGKDNGKQPKVAPITNVPITLSESK